IEDILPRLRSRILAVSFGFVVALVQVLLAMVGAWERKNGWPWELYHGALSEEAYLEQVTPGFPALRKMERGRPAWPRFWHTGFEPIGNINGIPIMAELWEFSLHGAQDRESIARYVDRAKCDYWVVRLDSPAARYMGNYGIRDRVWIPENFVMS